MTRSTFVAALLCSLVLVSACDADEPTPSGGDATSDANKVDVADSRSKTMTLSSTGIQDGVLLEAFRCETKNSDGNSDSLPLAWAGIPEGTAALAVTMHHYPMGSTDNPSSYFSLWNIDPSVTAIAHGAAADGPWYMGANKDGTGIGYTSPCSPSGAGHVYTITVYALSETPASLPTESSLDVGYSELVAAFKTVTVIATSTLVFSDG